MSVKENRENTSTPAESSIEGLFTLYNNVYYHDNCYHRNYFKTS